MRSSRVLGFDVEVPRGSWKDGCFRNCGVALHFGFLASMDPTLWDTIDRRVRTCNLLEAFERLAACAAPCSEFSQMHTWFQPIRLLPKKVKPKPNTKTKEIQLDTKRKMKLNVQIRGVCRKWRKG